MSNNNRKCRTGKVEYASHRRAMMTLANLMSYSRRDNVPERAYKCPLCGRWHLTCQPKRV